MAKYKSAVTGIFGVEEAKKDLQRFLRRARVDFSKITEDAARKAQIEAKIETPYQTGRLEDSVYVRVARDKTRPGFRLGARAQHPKTRKHYAWLQHENTQFKHPIKGKAKYLEDPFRRAIVEIRQKVHAKKYFE